MSDVFREVDDDLRREQLKRLWQRFGKFIIGAAVLVVVGVAVSVILTSMSEGRAAADGDRFYAAVALENAEDYDGARAAFTALRADGTTGYPILADFHLASIDAATGNTAAAVAAFDAIANSTTVDQELRDIATIRAAMVLLDTATYDQIAPRLAPLNVDGNAFRYLAIELLAVAAINEARYQDAWTLISTAMNFQDQMSQQQSQRFGDLFSFMISRDDFVPPTAATPAAPAAPTFQPGVAPAAPAAEPAPAAPMDLRAPVPTTTVPGVPGGLIPGLGGGVDVPAAGNPPAEPAAAPVAPAATPTPAPAAPATMAPPIQGGNIPGVGAGFQTNPAPAPAPAP
ncbi:MAG: tetratricopeptide repeat protein [Bauldia sp.]